MTTLRKTLTGAVATLALAGMMTVSFSSDAEAQRRWRRGNAGAAVAAGVIGAMALGAIAAGAAQQRPARCWIERRRVFDEYYGVWRIQRVERCR